MKMTLPLYRSRRMPQRGAAGFSLIELMIALGVFAIIAAAAVSLFTRHAPLYTSQTNQAQLTFTLRSALAQIEMDAVNAGSGYYLSADVPDWAIGITIVNNVPAAGVDCHTAATYTYGPNCFDQLNIISTDPNTPPSYPSGNNAGTTFADTSTGSAFLIPTPFTAAAATALAANYRNKDYVLFVQSLTSGYKMTAVILTANATVSGNAVLLTFGKTGPDAAGDPAGVNPNDTTFLIANTVDSTGVNNKLTNLFNNPPQTPMVDYALRLNTITYTSDNSTACGPTVFNCPASDPTNPKLLRISGRGNGHPLAQQDEVIEVLAEQIIGFKVGAVARSATADMPISFNVGQPWPIAGGGTCSSNCGFANDWSQIRAIRVSLIARTPPNPATPSTTRNSFDGGPYKIEGASVTINPRNLSMTD
jgi:prepilin-type N-terminal cleavage/methylation domain-containing protein